MVTRILLHILAAAFLVFLGMQFDRPERNESNDRSRHIATVFPVPDSVESILTVACYDCHSNDTRYPWYANIQPVAGWIAGHVEHGKKDLNFSEFAAYRMRRQYHKMEEVANMVRDSLMPIPDYLRMHKDAVLNDAQRRTLFAWVEATRDSMRTLYPADSLKARRRPQ